MTGVQALERKHPGLPMAPGKVERIEFEYIRRGTLSFIVSFLVAKGQIIVISSGPTRKEEDFVAHIKQVVGGTPSISHWHFVTDNLNIHNLNSAELGNNDLQILR